MRTKYSDRLPPEERGAIDFTGEVSRTKQAERDMVDVNAIVRKHRKSGVVSHLNGKAPQYGDFSRSATLQEALDGVDDAMYSFRRLPAEVRAMAENNPVRLLQMLATEDGSQMLIDAGLDPGFKREGDEEEVVSEPEAPVVETTE